MKKILLVAPLVFFAFFVSGQKAAGKLKFEQGQLLQVQTDFKSSVSQQAFGQGVEFNTTANVQHHYKVTNSTDENITLRHSTKQIMFTAEGMGQKRPFDSNNEKDMKGPFGPTVKDILSKTYDVIIGPSGTVKMAFPEKFNYAEMDERAKLIAGMMKDIFDIANPPKKGSASFFAVLPANEVSKGESWTESYENESGKFNNTYTLADITDSTFVISITGTSTTSSKAEVMGMEILTNMNNKSTGNIFVDKATGIIKQKEVTTESTGTTQGMGGQTPLTAKTVIKTAVTIVKE